MNNFEIINDIAIKAIKTRTEKYRLIYFWCQNFPLVVKAVLSYNSKL